jgi:hypothetical protein
MMTSFSKSLFLGAVALVAFTSAIPKNVYDIKNLCSAQKAEAQLLGGGGGGIAQNVAPFLIIMMMMNMMNQNKGNQLQREQASAAKNATSNLTKAGDQSNGGTQPGAVIPGGIKPSTNTDLTSNTDSLKAPIGSFASR